MKRSTGFLTLLLFYSSIQGSSQTPPNIILILADDLGYDDLSYRGSNEFYTPNIDALAYHGKVLKHFYTAAMCTPTRSALLSGKFPIRLGLQHQVISNEENRTLPLSTVTLPEVLSKAGYATNLVGKWHLGMAQKEYTPTYRGFDHHFGYWGSYIDFYTRTCKIQGDNFTYGYDFHRDLSLNCEHPNKYVTDLFTDEAERIILDKNRTQPLFLMLSHAAPHAANEENPLQAPEEIINQFSYIKDKDHRTYAAMVHKLDESVGRVVRAADQAGILNNTIIIFHSDNGAPSVDHLANTGSNWPMKGKKATPWEGAINVGGVIWSPLLSNRSSVFEQTMHVSDWFPTLIKAAGVKLSENIEFDGLDLWNQLKATQSNEMIERDMVHMLDDIAHMISYTHGPWKYINGTPSNGIYDTVLKFRELYDISTKNYTDEILKSLASQSLIKYDLNRLTAKRIESLRSRAGVKCKSEVRRSCNALLEECLYNIREDPCEENNLSQLSEYKDVLTDLRERIEVYRQNSVAPTVTYNNDLNDPSYHNCKWANFDEEPPTLVRKTCNPDAYTLFCSVHY